jgi:hypothetical protein
METERFHRVWKIPVQVVVAESAPSAGAKGAT